MKYDAIIIGGGVNGLTCAALLAKRGFRTVLVEARGTLGGVALLSHSAEIRRDVVEELELLTFGLRFLPSPIEVTALSPQGKPLVIWRDAAKTAAGLRTWSAKDAAAWPAFRDSVSRLAGVIGSLFAHTPPSVDDPGFRDAVSLLRTLSTFRGLPAADQWRLLRWGPMAVADLVGETFETEQLRAVLAADGIFGAMLGPWSAGSGLQMLLAATNRALTYPEGHAIEGGSSALTFALTKAAQRHGVEIRTGAAVARIDIENDRATGVTLDTGERLESRAVVSGVDPKNTFLKLCDADFVPPEFLWRMKHYRCRGTLAKINLTLSATPAFTGVTEDMLSAPIRIAPDLDYLERAFDHAKYGRWSPHPWIEFTIEDNVLSAYVQFAPYGLSREPGVGSRETNPSLWNSERDAFADAAINTLEQYAPGLKGLISAREIITPVDLEQRWGLTGGQIFHGELSLDQFFTMRPLLGFGQYRTPVRGVYLCGSGAHPGTGLTGGSGANAAREIARELS